MAMRYKYEVEWFIRPFNKPSSMVKRETISATSKKDAELWAKSVRRTEPRAYNIKIKKVM